MPIGYSWVWRDFPASLSFSFDTLRAVVKDIARSLERPGCRALLIVTAHGANPQPLKYTLRELRDENLVDDFRHVELQELLDELAAHDLGAGLDSNCLSLSRVRELPEVRQRNILRYVIYRLGLALPTEKQIGELQRQLLDARSDRQPALSW